MLTFWWRERGLAWNAGLKLASELVGRLASFALAIAAARYLGEAGFGLFSYGLALAFVLSQLADMGLQLLISREVAARGLAARPLLQTAFYLKVALSLPAFLLLLLATGGRPWPVQLSFAALGVALIAQTFVEFVAYVWRGRQRLGDEARLLAVARLLTAAVGGLVLGSGGGLPALTLAMSATTVLVAFWALRRLAREGWLFNRDTAAGADWQRLVQEAWPLGAATFLSIAYTRLAIFLLDYRLDEVAVAHFSAAQRLVEPAQLLPAALLAAIFPAYAAALHHNPARARRLGWSSVLALALAGGSVALAVWLAAPRLIPWLYGAPFVAATPVLQTLALSIWPAYVNYGLTHLLIAHGRQRWLFGLMALMLLLHATLSWRWITPMGAAGPALSILCAELLLFAGCLVALRSHHLADA